MICPNCGKEYNEKMTCCISCGSKLVPYDTATEQTYFEPVLAEAADEAASLPEKDLIKTSGEGSAGIVSGDIPADEPVSTVEVSVQTPERKFSHAARLIGSAAAAALMFALIMLSAASYTARLMTDKDKISEFAEALDVMSLPAAEAGIPSGEYDISPGATVQEAVYAMSDGTGLTREDIRNIYENSTAGEFLASQLTGYAGFIREGDMPERLTPEKLKSVFSENIGLISDSMDKPLSGHDIDLAFSELELAGPVLEAIAPANIESALGEGTMTFLRLFCSRPVMIGEACAAAAVMIIFWSINRRAGKVLGWGGGTIFAGGICILLTAFLCSMQIFFSGRDRFVREIAKSVTDVICPDLYRLGTVLAIVGAVMILWAATLRGARRN